MENNERIKVLEAYLALPLEERCSEFNYYALLLTKKKIDYYQKRNAIDKLKEHINNYFNTNIEA